ncbi:GNAT family N-acetyltransferase [Clostridiaceae bacterium DONG20-135]|uniref:GNAT family N-acetyltransferase n=1 Tax=Copranaerobaculum intestinale TaxID=2692629 RepID=A0A6N8U6N0_9FIRM|nr:GNAT family N-acetyltransferase [Copranaerobaculum intestinale]MXQ73551.1 GNAT family N-acetyltransferase [Copranaerobaculum intestinale]
MNVTIRPLVMSDLPDMVKAANDQGVSAFLRDRFPYPYTEEAGRSYLEFCENADPSQTLQYAILVNGKFAGTIGVEKACDVYRLNGELGYWLCRSYWGQGIATKAVSLMVKEAFAKLDINRIHAEVFEPNKASQRVLEKNGFVKEGHFHNSVIKYGQIIDSVIYAKLLK